MSKAGLEPTTERDFVARCVADGADAAGASAGARHGDDRRVGIVSESDPVAALVSGQVVRFARISI